MGTRYTHAMNGVCFPDGIEALTSDCYGTLIDWDRGVRGAIERIEGLAHCDVDRLARDREREDRELTREGYLPYDEVLRRSLAAAAAEQGCELDGAALLSFVETMARWPAFPDSGEALERLASRYRLVVLSNVQTRVLEASATLLGERFEHLITAEKLRCYKPRPAHWSEALVRLDLPSERILHVAQSLYHDVGPALALGWKVAWVNRTGIELPRDLTPTLVVPDMRTLADLAS